MAQHIQTNSVTSYNDEGKTDSNDKREGNVVDYGKDLSYEWYQFNFNANNVYFISIQLRTKPRSSMLSGGMFESEAWSKFGARRCTINGKPAKIIDILDNNNSQLKSTKKYSKMKYTNHEFIKLEQNGTLYQLFWLNSTLNWCLCDGNGIITKKKKKNLGVFKGK